MSNGTPRPNHARTKSAPKPFLWVGVTLLLIASVAAVMLGAFRPTDNPAATEGTLTVNADTSAKQTYKLETVTTTEDQARGLSGRTSLPADGGMEFKYGGVDERCIWMKDMNFTIDVIWLDANDRIVSMVPQMKPESYPRKYCAQAQTVIELPAGAIQKQGLRPGQILQRS